KCAEPFYEPWNSNPALTKIRRRFARCGDTAAPGKMNNLKDLWATSGRRPAKMAPPKRGQVVGGRYPFTGAVMVTESGTRGKLRRAIVHSHCAEKIRQRARRARLSGARHRSTPPGGAGAPG